MWSSVELRELRVFLTLAEELHYGRTAERLGLTASRVSQTIRTLERRLGGRLFDRTSRRVRLTPLGEKLRAGVAPAYDQLRDAYLATQEMATGVAGPLRLGMYSRANGGPLLNEIVKRFHERHPACHVELIETGFERNQLDWLRHGDADLLAMRLPLEQPGVVVGPILSDESRVLIVSRDHPLAGRSAIDYDEIAPYAVPTTTLPAEMMDAFAPRFTPSGQSVRRVMTHGIHEALMRVATGEVVHPTIGSFLDYYPHPDVTAIPIRDLPNSQTALVWLRTNRSQKITAFVQVTTAVLQSRGRRSSTS